jgi:dsDNA-specific endonuclease/ATPase MutS2
MNPATAFHANRVMRAGARPRKLEAMFDQTSTPSRAVPRLGLLLAGLLLIAAIAVGCGESDEEKARNQVCDARADLNKQVTELSALTPATATTDGVQQNLDAIKNDLNEIKDAQGDLNEDRKQQVESANQEFSAQVQAVASDLGTNLSASGAKAQLQSAAAQLQTAYKQTFAQVDCG